MSNPIVGGRPRSLPELDALDVGAALVIPWRLDASGAIDRKAQKVISRTIQRRAVILERSFHCVGFGMGLRVTRTA